MNQERQLFEENQRLKGRLWWQQQQYATANRQLKARLAWFAAGLLLLFFALVWGCVEVVRSAIERLS